MVRHAMQDLRATRRPFGARHGAAALMASMVAACAAPAIDPMTATFPPPQHIERSYDDETPYKQALARLKGKGPGQIIDAAPAADWARIARDDLLVMDLPPLNGKPRRVVVALVPAPFAANWVANIRTLARAQWWDGTAIVRVQDNYVTQWGDPTEKKPLPATMLATSEADYLTRFSDEDIGRMISKNYSSSAYAANETYAGPFALAGPPEYLTAAHCYGAVGVGRNLSPDAGTGAELYTVIGHAPRQLDQNIAVVGRVISGMEWLSSLPRGTGNLGFYETAAERTPIVRVRLGSAVSDLGDFEYLRPDSGSFADYLFVRANRNDDFYKVQAGGVDLCNAQVPVRPVKAK